MMNLDIQESSVFTDLSWSVQAASIFLQPERPMNGRAAFCRVRPKTIIARIDMHFLRTQFL